MPRARKLRHVVERQNRPCRHRDRFRVDGGQEIARPSGDRSSVSCLVDFRVELENPIKEGFSWWTHKGSNLGPLPCEGNALPLSYASGKLARDRKPTGHPIEDTPWSPRFTNCRVGVSSTS